ncbi:MAG: DUF1282 domain-containing protein [Candidatus Dadabacteria bacterium]|nr:MAG: DUF1282 domain-containing protein [Candidatus Dadabacteria bacterium]
MWVCYVNTTVQRCQGYLGRLGNRVLNILFRPRAVWQDIASDRDSVWDIYIKYLLLLAAIGPVCEFFGNFIAKTGHTILSSFLASLLAYLVQLFMVYMCAWVVEKLAWLYGGSVSRINSFRLAAFSMVPVFLGGVLSLALPYRYLNFIFILYSLFIFRNGLGQLTDIPEAKQNDYTLMALATMLLFGVLTWIVINGARFLVVLGIIKLIQ